MQSLQQHEINRPWKCYLTKNVLMEQAKMITTKQWYLIGQWDEPRYAYKVKKRLSDLATALGLELALEYSYEPQYGKLLARKQQTQG